MKIRPLGAELFHAAR